MGAENFQLIDETVFNNSNIQRHSIKNCHQQGVNKNDSSEKIDFVFGENSNYQVGNAYLLFELTRQKIGGHFENDNTDLIK